MTEQVTTDDSSIDSAASALSAGLGGWCAPAGWTVEMPEHTPNCIMISTGNGEWITVDMDKRIFGLGYARPRPWRESMTFSVKGPNWRGRLLSAAVEYLQAEMTPNDLGEGRERGILREASSGEAATSTAGLGVAVPPPPTFEQGD